MLLIMNFFESDTNSFVQALHQELKKQNINIVNNPNQYPIIFLSRFLGLDSLTPYILALQNLSLIRGYCTELIKFYKKNGCRYSLDNQIGYFGPKGKRMSLQQIDAYNEAYGQLAMTTQVGGCDELCAVALHLAKKLLETQAFSQKGIIVDICALRNYTHTFLRISYPDEANKRAFFYYDPWFVLCFADNNPNLLIPMKDYENHIAHLCKYTYGALKPIHPFDHTTFAIRVLNGKPIIAGDRKAVHEQNYDFAVMYSTNQRFIHLRYIQHQAFLEEQEPPQKLSF